MDAAFLVAVPLPGRQIPDACRALLAQHDLRLFEREPVDYVRWKARGGAMVAAWQYDHGGVLDGTPWATSADGFAMSTGNLRWSGDPWRDRPARAQRLLHDAAVASLDQVIGRPRGVFTALVVRSDGHGAIGADPLGLRFLYYGSNDDLFVASTSATLAARALTADGKPPARDAVAVAWLAFSGYRIDDRSGYEGVRLLPQGATIVLEPGETPVVRTAEDPWRPGDDLRNRRPDQLVDIVQEEIADTLRATAAIPVPNRVVDLTGGKDSRLVLAVVLSEGLEDAFTFRTIGHTDLPDVQVAGGLAARLGLDFTSDFPMHGKRKAYEEELHGFLEASTGMTSIGDLKPLRPRVTDEVIAAGLLGECLRLKDRFDYVSRSGIELVNLVDAKVRYGVLHVLRPEVEKEFRSRFRAALERCASESDDPFDAMHSYYVRYRVRKRGGPLYDLDPSLRIVPLYSIVATRAAFAIGGIDRQRELVHFEIMRRVSDVLVTSPFLGPGWAPGLLDGQPSTTGQSSHASSSTRVASRRDAPQVPQTTEGLMARLTRESFDRRRHVWHEALRDTANPAWDVIDQHVALRALERFPSLSGAERRELLGAITAALWLRGTKA